MTADPDIALAAAVARGDQQAFAVLFDRHSADVFRYAWVVADSPADVDDLVQEVFVVAWRRRRELPDGAASMLPWLLVTCRNLARNANRRRRRDAIDGLTDAAPLDREQARRAERARAVARLRWVQAAIDELPSVERALCERCLVDGEPYEIVAAELGLTPAAARKRVQRLRERLRAARSAQEED